MQRSETPKALAGIQYLRFVAAALVVFHHAYKQVPKYGTGDLGVDFASGAWGVDLFFVISGFIMLMITDRRETSPLEFLSRRLARVAPMYWLATLVMTVALFVAPSAFDHSKFDPSQLFASLGFIAWPHDGVEGAMPVLQVGWTLNFEMFFYLVFAVALLLSWRWRGLVAGTVIGALVVLGLATHPSGERLQFYTNPIMLEFVFGMVVANLYLSRRLLGPRASTLLIVSGVAWWLLVLGHAPPRLGPWRFALWGVPAAPVVIGALGLELHSKMPQWPILRTLGDASYSIYLTHFFTLGAIRLFWAKAHLTHRVTDGVFLPLSIGLSLLVGYLVFRFVERPVTAFAQSIAIPKPRPQLATASIG